MEYWALINNNRIGPLTPEQLQPHGITGETLVWCNGMPEWTPARYVAELQSIIVPSHSPGSGQYDQPQEVAVAAASSLPPSPPSYLVWSILCMVLCCQVGGLVALIYSILVEYRYSHGNYEGAERASKTAFWWIIGSVAVTCLSIPILIMTGVLSALFG